MSNVPRGSNSEYIRRVFSRYEIEDVNFHPKGGCAISFLAVNDPADILEKFSNGIWFEKRKLWVNEFQGKKGKNKRPLARAPTPAPAATPAPVSINTDDLTAKAAAMSLGNSAIIITKPTTRQTEVIVKNLNYQATEQGIKHLFNNFKLSKVNLKHGCAFVGLESQDEAQRAVNQLNERKVLGRKVFVELTRPKWGGF